MKLTYHQATYDLLTQNSINPQKAIDHFDQWESTIGQSAHARLTPGEAQKKRDQWRTETLTWTRLDLFQRPARKSEANVSKLDAREKRYGIRIPEAVREWYSLDIVPDIMSARGWGLFDIDRFQTLAEMAEPWMPAPRDDMICFLYDEYINQGGEYFFFGLSSGDDPPVLAAYARRLIQIAPKFSEFMYLHFWDWLGLYMFDHSLHLTHDPEITSLQIPDRFHVPLKRLREHYSELSSNLATRFYDDHIRIWVRNSITGDGEITPRDVLKGADFQSDSLDALSDAIAYLWADDPPVFLMNAWLDQETPEWLSKLQREQLRRTFQTITGWISGPDLAFKLGASIPVLSTPMAQQLQWLIGQGEVDTDPENERRDRSEHRFRASR